MGRVPIATEHRTGEGFDKFPRIKLNEKGEKTRFTLIEVPWREYVHYFKAPEFGPNGKVVKEKKTRRDGTEYEDNKLEFIGSPICLGDDAVIIEKGLDEKNCPGCEAAVKSGGDIPGPVARFAVNVMEYGLRGSGAELKKPFSAEVKVWAFNGRTYDEIEGIQGEIGDLRKHDIVLECEDAYWQRNKLSFKMDPGYAQGEKAYIRELLTTPGNKATDQQLKDACGRDTPRARMADDAEHVLRQWRRLRTENTDNAYDTSTGVVDLDGGLDLLAEEAVDPDGGNALTGGGTDPFAEFGEETTSNPSPQAAASRKPAASDSDGESEDSSAPAATPASPKAARPSKAKAQAAPAPEDELDAILGGEDDGQPTPEVRGLPDSPPASGDDFSFDDLMSGVDG